MYLHVLRMNFFDIFRSPSLSCQQISTNGRPHSIQLHHSNAHPNEMSTIKAKKGQFFKFYFLYCNII